MVEIDESTEAVKVPVKKIPFSQAIVKILPRWGKLLIPATLPGILAAVVVVGLYPMLTPIKPDLFLMGHLALCGLLPGILAPFLGRLMRRVPMKVFQWGMFTTVALYVLGRPFGSAFGMYRTTLITFAVVSATIAANCLVERLTAGYRFSKPPIPLLMVFMRPVLTAVGLVAMLVFMTIIFGPHPFSRFWAEILVVGLFGLFVAAPPMELAKSAYYHRLISESLSGEDDSK